MFTLEDFKEFKPVCTSDFSKYGIICRSELEANECCEWLDSIGREWSAGGSFLEHTKYDMSDGVICYYDDGTYLECEDKTKRYAEDYMEWSVLKEGIFQEPDLFNSDSLEAMLGDVEVY